MIQTQILLAIVGAIVMLVVGQSLARAFGIVGVASLVRYRAKIQDPKDAGVMLACLGIGLACGVGLYLIAIFATAFLIGFLWWVESLEPEPVQRFLLDVAAPDPEGMRKNLEQLLRRHRAVFELRALSGEQISYEVALPLDQSTDRLSSAIAALERRRGDGRAVGREEGRLTEPAPRWIDADACCGSVDGDRVGVGVRRARRRARAADRRRRSCAGSIRGTRAATTARCARARASARACSASTSTEEARDRRSTSALDLGAAAYFDGPDEAQFIPFASLYFWRRPDERRFLRATVGGIYNDVVAARSFGDSPFEAVFAFENNTVLFDDNSQWVDGERDEDEELRKMWVRGGVGRGLPAPARARLDSARVRRRRASAATGQHVLDLSAGGAQVPLLQRAQLRPELRVAAGHVRARGAPRDALGFARAQPDGPRAPGLRGGLRWDLRLALELGGLGHRRACTAPTAAAIRS